MHQADLKRLLVFAWEPALFSLNTEKRHPCCSHPEVCKFPARSLGSARGSSSVPEPAVLTLIALSPHTAALAQDEDTGTPGATQFSCAPRADASMCLCIGAAVGADRQTWLGQDQSCQHQQQTQLCSLLALSLNLSLRCDTLTAALESCSLPGRVCTGPGGQEEPRRAPCSLCLSSCLSSRSNRTSSGLLCRRLPGTLSSNRRE